LRRRLGGRAPIARVGSTGRRFTDAFAISPDGGVECRRCGTRLAGPGQDPYAALLDEVGLVRDVAPWSVAYPGGERFALHRLHCPACAVRVEVQVRLRDEPVLRAAEPLA
jgi:DNA-directed RNA polymerase subunit RPC12/RpoP